MQLRLLRKRNEFKHQFGTLFRAQSSQLTYRWSRQHILVLCHNSLGQHDRNLALQHSHHDSIGGAVFMATSASDRYIRIKQDRVGIFCPNHFPMNEASVIPCCATSCSRFQRRTAIAKLAIRFGNLFLRSCPGGFVRSALAGQVSLFHNPNNAAISNFEAPARAGLLDSRAPSRNSPCRNIFLSKHLQRCRKNRPYL